MTADSVAAMRAALIQGYFTISVRSAIHAMNIATAMPTLYNH